MNEYITVGDFKTTTKVKSDLYGVYNSTKIVTLDFIKACNNGALQEVVDYYSKLTKLIRTYTLHSLERKWVVNQYLDKVEVYAPLIEHNTDYVDSKGIYKELPVGYEKDYIIDRIAEC